MASGGLLVAGASFAAFQGLHWGLQLMPTPESVRDRWMWRNIFVSLMHSLLSGTGALVGLWLFPQMVTDPIYDHPSWARVLVAVSVGYFVADGVDMLWNQTLAQAWDLLCHHLVVVSCLSTAVVSGHFVGFSMVSLLLELNSICLHLRKLLLLSHKASSLAFRVSSWATLTTLVLFRLLPLGWMSLWLFQQHYQPRPYPFILVHKETQQTKTCEPVTRNNSTLSLKGMEVFSSVNPQGGGAGKRRW
ncbi:TLC domain-containing protein 2 isoform X2 [Rattus norvegicus]|uniref:TLC domain-containing protein 2 isoform X2 n=1 Tax=Rattus norvegicus TaxID=10116 RepID=UPI0003D0A9CD|nr:TLC domain-containing protein 2 isoform X3 [Rattus norvegicus]|eukprot:XP_006246931.1 PREDICTED: TLC domain-containing protein 2 isoform X2 [Rattus norvegicus]